MTKKKVLIVSILAVALLTAVLSLIFYIISLPSKPVEIEKPKFEYGEYTIRYEEDYEPGASTTYHLHKDGSIEYTHTRYCSAKDCEPETTELKKLEFSEENLKLTYKFLVSLLEEKKEITIYSSQIKDDKTNSLMFYISDEREELISLEMSDYDYKLELYKNNNFHLIYLEDDKINVGNLIYENYDLKEITKHTINFENNKIIKSFIVEQFDKKETFKNIYYSAYEYKDKLILDAIIANDESLIKDLSNVKELLYTLKFVGLDCLTPTLDIYDDKSYDYNYTYTTDGSEPTPLKGTYDYDINKLLKTTKSDEVPDHPAGYFYLSNKKKSYYLGMEDKDLADFLASANLSTASFMCSLELERNNEAN
jgi:hypothetical protein